MSVELCTELTIDKEFAGLCPMPTAEECDLLEASLAAEGCRDPIVTWANHDDMILDGHTRYRICRREAIPFKIKPLMFDSRGECINWIIGNQLGRRNLTDEQKAYLRGRRYNAEKAPHGGDRKSSDYAASLDPGRKTPEELAEEYGISVPTLRKDAKYAEAVDTIGDTLGPEAKAKVLSGDGNGRPSKKAVVEAAKLPPKKMAKALAPAAKPHKPKTQRNQFNILKEAVARCQPLADALQREKPADKFHDDIIRQLKAIDPVIEDWRKATR